jgi:FMN reductase
MTSATDKRAPSIVGISGNIKRPSNTRVLIQTVLDRIEATYHIEGSLFDLLDAPELGTAWDFANIKGPLAELIASIESADVLVVGSPVYKGSYTGLFKHLFDLIGYDRLIGKPVILTASGGGDRHALVVEHQLRPLFGFFTAHSMATAVYVSESDFVDGAIESASVLKRIDCAVAELKPWLWRICVSHRAQLCSPHSEM